MTPPWEATSTTAGDADGQLIGQQLQRAAVTARRAERIRFSDDALKRKINKRVGRSDDLRRVLEDFMETEPQGPRSSSLPIREAGDNKDGGTGESY